MNKILRIGTISTGNQRASVYFKVENSRGQWSFTGVIGPRRSGNAAGGCGQIVMEFAHRRNQDNDRRFTSLIKPENVRFAKGWNRDKLLDFINAWETYHLKTAMPQEVVDFLVALPDTDKHPAWV